RYRSASSATAAAPPRSARGALRNSTSPTPHRPDTMPTVVDPTSSGPAALGDPRAGRVRREVLRDYYHLTKPGITRLVVLTTAVGFYMASAGPLDVWRLLHAIIG